jgi:hypothetical protein
MVSHVPNHSNQQLPEFLQQQLTLSAAMQAVLCRRGQRQAVQAAPHLQAGCEPEGKCIAVAQQHPWPYTIGCRNVT